MERKSILGLVKLWDGSVKIDEAFHYVVFRTWDRNCQNNGLIVKSNTADGVHVFGSTTD